MDDETNHYAILGLPSSGGAKYSEKEITKAYKMKALELHPDKRPDDDVDKAKADIQRLNASYAILKYEKTRKLYDQHLLIVRVRELDKAPRLHSPQHDAKRQKMMSGLDRRERDSFAFGLEEKSQKEAEEWISRKFNEEVASNRAEQQPTWTGKVDSSNKEGLSRMRGNEITSRLETSYTSTTQEPRPPFGAARKFPDEAKVLDKFQKVPMARNIDLVPGPITAEVLYIQDSHISQTIWDNPTVEKVKRVNNFNHLPRITHPGVLYYIHQAGFYGLYHLSFVRIDNPLITALIERWRPETHTFHLPVGECTITLQDVEVLAGVRVDGQAVIMSETDSTVEARIRWVEELIGTPGPNTFQRDGLLSIRWLVDNYDPQELAPHAPDDSVRRVARACILRILASQFLQDKQGSGVQLHYLPYLRDFQSCGLYSWGSAILAFLYRSMCNAAAGKTEQVNGALVLLQCWAWSRFRQIRPNDSLPTEQAPPDGLPRYPYGRRWTTCAIRYNGGGIGHSLRVYRDQFDQMRADQVIWEPYKNEMPNLPNECVAGQHIWCARVPLICTDIVEWHYPDRVMRQFGLKQVVPQATNRDDALHRLSRKGNPKYDWAKRHAYWITIWDARHQHVESGQLHDGIQTLSDEYMSWYQRITRRWIVPPITRAPSRGIQPTAGVTEVLYQGVCSSYQLFMQHGIGDGIACCLQVFSTLGISPPDVEQPEASHQPDSPH